MAKKADTYTKRILQTQANSMSPHKSEQQKRKANSKNVYPHQMTIGDARKEANKRTGK